VLLGWRRTTIDVDLKLVPEQDAVLRAIPGLKDELQVNVELAAPGDFIPLPGGWEERSLPAEQGGRLAFYHFDPYAQALSKLERDHARDRDDVRALIRSGLVEPERLRRYFEEIEPQLYRFPAIDPPAFRERVEQARTIEPDHGQAPEF
jgi:hypothetical protein